jgi:hypothetical protein
MLIAAIAAGAILFSADFQDGKAPGWGLSGGDVRLTTYQDNVSMRLQGGGQAQLSMTLPGGGNVVVRAAMAALSLEAGDACLVEASADGAAWRTVVKVETGRDDAVTLWRGAATVASAGKLFLRVRAVGDSGDVCWADDIQVERPPAPQVAGARIDLFAADLAGLAPPKGPVPASAFAPSAGAAAPAARFEGMLTLEPSIAGVETRLDRFRQAKAARNIPGISIGFVQDGDRLIPAQRGPLAGAAGAWSWLFEPGRVWREAGDGDWTRAAVPFALEEYNANCLHNGLLTFLFKADGETSQAVWQIGSETCGYLQFDAWGTARAAYRPGPVPGAADLVAADRVLLARRLPRRTLADLKAAFPQVDLASLDGEKTPGGVTAFGLVVDGVHYASDCPTRFGPDPFCAERDLPSYSMAKSLFAGLGLMRLELLSPGAGEARIDGLAPACGGPAWRDVTLDNLLDMASGHWSDPGYMADEDGPMTSRFLGIESNAERLSVACNAFPRRAPPGRRWVYRTADTWILGAALSAEVRRLGLAGDSYEALVAGPLWRPLGLSPVAMTTRRSPDTAAQPFTGYGLVFQGDDLARIGGWLRGGALVDGKPAVDPAELAKAMQGDPAGRGLEAGWPIFRYQNGFWARDVGPLLGCAEPVWVPFMSGYGGISLVMFPNGLTFWMVSDSYEHSWSDVARAAHSIRSLCP